MSGDMVLFFSKKIFLVIIGCVSVRVEILVTWKNDIFGNLGGASIKMRKSGRMEERYFWRFRRCVDQDEKFWPHGRTIFLAILDGGSVRAESLAAWNGIAGDLSGVSVRVRNPGRIERYCRRFLVVRDKERGPREH